MSKTSQEVLKVTDLCVKQRQRTLLQQVNFHINVGEVVAIIGANGAGKSTLFKSICGEQALYKGKILLNNQLIGDYSRLKLAQHLAVLPQSSSLSFPFTVREVVSLGRIHRPDTKLKKQKIIDFLLVKMDILHLAERLYTQLSGGERQRVHWVRVLAQIWDKPEQGARCLLLDEPTAALDLAHQHQALAELKRLAKEQIGIAVILHDLNLAARYTDRVILLHQGTILADGSPWEVLQEDILYKGFGIKLKTINHPDLDIPLLVS